MKKRLLPAIILVLIILIFIGLFILGNVLNNAFQKNNSESENKSTKDSEKTCTDFGCEPGSKYIGSINSDKFYTCDCHYANRIHSKNIICFKSKSEAQEQDYEFLEC